MTGIKLRDLFADVPLIPVEGFPDSTIVRGIVSDSRKIEPGDLFVATVGMQVDAHHFIPEAISRGAVAVVGEQSGIRIEVPYVRVKKARLALALLSASFYRFPARKLTVIGVTGTDGKTTTCNLIYQILLESGLKTGMITTVNAVIGEETFDTGFHVTTPDAPVLQKYLDDMVAKGLTHVVLETTSHGWSQYRVDGCEFDIGVITNVTHEHLDEHGNFESYLNAKGRLFESLSETHRKPSGNPRLGVLNKDDQSYQYLKSLSPKGYKTYSLLDASDLTAVNIKLSATESQFDAIGTDWEVPVLCRLPGRHNISNCLAAMTATIEGLGIEPYTASRGIKNLSGIPGRMESIDVGQSFNAIVDFAHTPNALLNTIRTIRDFTSGRVITIFGSAGLRDRKKRRMMAEISAKQADITILTAEDPRSESLDDILDEMSDAAREGGGVEEKTFWRIPDRREAIRFGIHIAQKGDTVISCGKGHEQSMCFGDTEYPWDDRTAMRAAISERLGIEGPIMPFLPEINKME